eukprot:14058689-Alexandrium_andersonii.AAC.1
MSDKLGEIVESYGKLQKKGEELDRREAALEQKVEQLAKATAINHQTSASLAKSVAKYGRRSDLALASALWCSEGQKTIENRQASREALTTEWPRSMPFHQRQQTVQEFCRWINCSDYSHTEPAGHADSARTAIACFKSKYARDNFLAA